MTSSPDLSWVSSPSTRAITLSSLNPTTMPFLTPMTVPTSLVSKVWGLKLSREILSNIREHSPHFVVEAHDHDHVPEPHQHAGAERRVDRFRDRDVPARRRREDRVKPFFLRRAEGKRRRDVNHVGHELQALSVGASDLVDELIDEIVMDRLREGAREHATEDVRREADRL